MKELVRHGLVFNPNLFKDEFYLLHSHASVPCALPLDERYIKVF